VHGLVVKVDHPDLPESWDVWWREDYECFVAQYADAEQDFAIRPASLENVATIIDLLNPTAPTVALFRKGLIPIGTGTRTQLRGLRVIARDDEIDSVPSGYPVNLIILLYGDKARFAWFDRSPFPSPVILHQNWRRHHPYHSTRGAWQLMDY
jgi:hypothetical protein